MRMAGSVDFGSMEAGELKASWCEFMIVWVSRITSF